MKNFNYYILFFLFWITSFCFTIPLQAQNNNALNFKAGDFVTLSSDFGNGIDNTAPLNNFTDNDFTIEFWIKATTTGSNQVILSKWDDTAADNSFIAQLLSTGELEFKVEVEVSNNSILSMQSNTIIDDDIWHHVALVFQTSEGLYGEMYIDGRRQENTISPENSVDIKTPPHSFLLGKQLLTPASFKGTLDELRIWETYRSECEIRANMNGEIDPFSTSNLLAYYTFNQGITNGTNNAPRIDSLFDISGNNRNGLLNNNFTLTGTTSNWVDGITPDPSPVLVLIGNYYMEIENGDVTPSFEDNTDFGRVESFRDISYEIKNFGINDLRINNVSFITNPNNQFSIISFPSSLTEISSCSSEEMIIRFEPTTVGIQQAIVKIESNDPTIPNYTFTIQGRAAPQINLTGTTDFGNVGKCEVIRETYTITNEGSDDLILYGKVRISGNSAFKVVSQPTVSSIAPNGTATFEVEYSPTENDAQKATIFVNSNSAPSVGTSSLFIQAAGNPATYPNYEWQTLGNVGFSAVNTKFHSLKIDNNGTPYVAFQEGASQKTSVMKYNGTTWQYVGGAGISAGIASYQSLAIDDNGNLYVAYQDGSNGNTTTVLKYNGTSWITLGSDISGVNNSSQNIAIDREGTVFIAFRNTTGKAKVMKYTGSNWQNVGTDDDGFSLSTASYVSLAISSYGELYVAYKDETNTNTVDQGTTLMYFDRLYNEWSNYSDSDFFPNSTQQNLALKTNGRPYIALLDGTTPKVLFNPEGWYVYGSDISTSPITTIGNIVIDVDGAIYFCFKDEENGGKATVRKISNGDWEDVGVVGFSQGQIGNINLALDNNGVLYVTYSDLTHNGKTTVKHFLPNNNTPKIRLKGNATNIANGSTTPNRTNTTDFGNIESTKSITYTIENNGNLGLDIFSIDIIGATEFSITIPPTNNIISPPNSTTFEVTFTRSTIGLRTATIQINNGDCATPAYTFNIQANGVATPPSIEVTQGTTIINNGDDYDFGNVTNCRNGTPRSFTITNTGAADLDITSFSQSPNPAFVVTGSTPRTIAQNEKLTFLVTFNSSSTLTQYADIQIENNSTNAAPIFEFNVSATGVPDTYAPTLVAMQNFVKNTDSTNCFYTNIRTTTNSVIRGLANDNCEIASYNYVLSGATVGNISSLENVKFNKGITTINWTARDASGLISNPNQFTVTVVDTQSPFIQAPDDIIRTSDLYRCTLDSTGINLGTPLVSDNCSFRVFNDAPAQFSLGQTTIIWTAIDSAGNQSTANQLVTITDPFFVSPSDSLILVNMYNQMGGQNWRNSWNLNKPVSTWSGISVSCGKIVLINLSNNNLTGTLPTSVLNLAQINAPNFSLNIGGNKLSFESAEDFVGLISNFIYSPQAKIYVPSIETIRESQSITLNSQTEGNFTSYQWYKNQSRINGATSPTLTITNARPSDAGMYVCEMKNTVATQLILERNPITLIVEGFVNPTDSLALVAIFQQTGGTTTWTNPWDLFQPIATWEGITLSGNKLRELDLSSRNLTGKLPNVFDADLFSELRYLSFFDNNLEGQIPATIGDITTLTYLDLDKNNFEGSVPASFGNLINLEALWLSRNNLTELPNEIGNLKNLKNLYLNDNKFTLLPETIGNLIQLLILNVSNNELSSLPNSITNLKKLVEFYANHNLISALPTGIQNLIALAVLEMNTNNLSSLDLNLLQLANLKTLRIAENKLEFDDLLPFVSTTFTVFDYSPQAPINEEMDILIPVNSSFTFTLITQGNGNRFQWLRDGNPISTLQNFTINRVRNTDAGFYTALITNPSLPNLTLQRRFVHLNVECQAGLNFEIKEPQQTVFCEGQPFGLKLEVNEDFNVISQIRWRKDGIPIAFATEKSFTVTQKGVYTAEILTSNGCTVLSSKVEITTLPNPEVIISLENEKILTSTINSQEIISYQWLKDGDPIENAFEISYTPTQTGEYSLLVLTKSGCSSVSQTIIFTGSGVTGIEEPKEFRNLALYPNPNNGTFFIDFGTNSPNGEATFILIDAIGRQLNLKTEKISSTRFKVITNHLTGGIYQLQIQTKDGIAFRKFVIEE